MNLHDDDGHFDQEGQRDIASEQTKNDRDSAKEFRSGGKISHPSRDAQRADELLMSMEPAEDFFVSVRDHDRSKHQTHDQECERLHAIERIQKTPPSIGKELRYQKTRSQGSRRIYCEVKLFV